MEKSLINMMRIFLDSIRDYEHECGSPICFDERTSEEFVEIFVKSEDAFEYNKLLKILNAQDEVRSVTLHEKSGSICDCPVPSYTLENRHKCVKCGKYIKWD